MPVTIGGLIAGAFTGLAEGAAAIAPEAIAGAADVAATGAVEGGVIGGGVEAITAAGGALPEIGITAPAIGAFADPTAAALAGEGAVAGSTALATPGELATLGVGGLAAGAIAGGGLGTPSAGPTAPITAGVPTGAGAGAGAVPSDVLPPLASTPGATAVAALNGGVPGGGVGGASDVFAGAPAGTEGQIPSDLATAINTSGAGNPPAESLADLLANTPGQLTAGTGVPTPQPLDIPTSIGATPLSASGATGGTPLTQTGALATFEGSVPTEANPNVGGQFGSPAPVAAAPGAAGGVGSFLRTAGMLAPLGALGMVLARGQPSLPPAEQQALNNIGPIQSFATQQITNAQNNQITPAQAAEIAIYKQNAQNQLYQQIASSGRNPAGDTEYIQGLQQIDQTALAMQQSFIDSMIKNGLAAAGVVDSTLQSAANIQVANDNAFQNSVSSALNSFGLVAAINTIGSKAA